MTIQPCHIPLEGADREGEEPAEILELAEDDCLRVRGPVSYRLHIQIAAHELVASGVVSVPGSFRCARCAAWFDREVSDERFLVATPFVDETQLVDLTPDIREAIILALSAHPVCRPECQGLCMRCGADLNEGPCKCPAPEELRWGALDNLTPQRAKE
jgi:uncharacterized protein